MSYEVPRQEVSPAEVLKFNHTVDQLYAEALAGHEIRGIRPQIDSRSGTAVWQIGESSVSISRPESGSDERSITLKELHQETGRAYTREDTYSLDPDNPTIFRTETERPITIDPRRKDSASTVFPFGAGDYESTLQGLRDMLADSREPSVPSSAKRRFVRHFHLAK